MKSFGELSSMFTDLSQNSSTANATRGKALINDRHRYLIQKYFDNLQFGVVGTVGGNDYTLTGAMSGTETSATLSSSWTLNTGYQLVNFSSGEQRNVLFTNGSTAISWGVALTEAATTAISTVGQQYYNLAANVSKVRDITVTVGQQKFTPKPVQTQAEWDIINALPYTSDIPQYVYVSQGTLGVFPIPSTTGNVITFNFKLRVPNMTYDDFSTGTVAGTAGSTAITGSSTTWNSVGTFPLSTDLTFANLFLKITPPKGDGLSYQVRTFASDTALTLVQPLVQTPLTPLTGASYTLCQYPLLQEDFHDMLVFGALMVYFSSINKQQDQYQLYKDLYTEREKLLADYAGTRQVNVDLGEAPNPVNPNLFIYSTSS